MNFYQTCTNPMIRQLPIEKIQPILQNEDISLLTYNQLVELFNHELRSDTPSLKQNFQVDPRSGDRIIFNPARATRPQDNVQPSQKECVICQGQTTGILDIYPLCEGYTFINKNLFPMVRPTNQKNNAHGLHFLQWTSSHHDVDWHNLDPTDQLIVLQRLAALEQCLLTSGNEYMPEHTTWGGLAGHRGFVSIIKNGGHLVGGSLAHGHQQIAYINTIPRRILEDWQYYQDNDMTFSRHLMMKNPSNLTITDMDHATLLVPYFMQRPFNMILVVKDVQKRYLYELTTDELKSVARGWHLAIACIYSLMPKLGREIAYNVISHNGPSAGIYFEFLPYTQEIGGFEHLGLMVCQADPKNIAADLQRIVSNLQ